MIARGSRIFVALAVVAAALLSNCSRGGRPSVVLITIDTLRADRLSCYGSQVTQTPAADLLAREGVLFESAAAPLPETRPSHFSLFTSRYPREHGVVSNVFSLSEDAVTLAEVYVAAGYQTAAFTGCVLLDRRSGADQGFEVFDAPEQPQRPANEVVPKALRWLRAIEPSRPFFLWIHLFDPHMPYEPPAPYVESSRITGTQLTSLTWPEILENADSNGGDLPVEILTRGLELYGGEVEYADHWVGVLTEELRRLDRWQETITILTADHGECFSNGIFFDHSTCLYDGAIRIPLIIRYPPAVAVGVRVDEQVENLDIAPTLLRLSKLEIPSTFQGHDLLLERQPKDRRPAFLQHPLYRHFDVVERQKVMDRLRSVAGIPTRQILGDQEMTGARTQRWKYLVAGREEQLYDLEQDPGEQIDVMSLEPEVLDELRRQTRSWRRDYPLELQNPAEIDDKILENLRALGYL